MLRALLIVLVLPCLVAGLAGGLVRAGLAWDAGDWLGHAAAAHAALMISAFFGALVSLERAVALKTRTAFAVPLAAAAGGICLVFGFSQTAELLFVLAGAAFAVVNVGIVQRQRQAHTVLLLVAAIAWLAGSLAYIGALAAATLNGWFAFLVLTIAAERLEMTRLMRRQPGAMASFLAIVSSLLVGTALSFFAEQAGSALYGAALVSLAIWLMRHDIARRTVHAKGLSRYMAVCLLAGYVWLGIAGIAWTALAFGELAARDAALHALGIGFVLSMVMGHAPVILPALTRVKVAFGWWYYLPLALLHGSLLLRLAGGAIDMQWRTRGASLNIAALLVFALSMAVGALIWRRAKR